MTVPTSLRPAFTEVLVEAARSCVVGYSLDEKVDSGYDAILLWSGRRKPN